MKKWLMILSIVIVLGGLITYQMLSLAKIECSLCVKFKDRYQCAKAYGPNEYEATREAHQNACSQIASGVTEIVACSHLLDEKISCESRSGKP